MIAYSFAFRASLFIGFLFWHVTVAQRANPVDRDKCISEQTELMKRVENLQKHERSNPTYNIAGYSIEMMAKLICDLLNPTNGVAAHSRRSLNTDSLAKHQPYPSNMDIHTRRTYNSIHPNSRRSNNAYDSDTFSGFSTTSSDKPKPPVIDLGLDQETYRSQLDDKIGFPSGIANDNLNMNAFKQQQQLQQQSTNMNYNNCPGGTSRTGGSPGLSDDQFQKLISMISDKTEPPNAQAIDATQWDL